MSAALRTSAGLLAGLALCLALAGCARHSRQRHQAHAIGSFDTVTMLVGYAESRGDFNRYAGIVFAKLETLHKLYDIFNAYDGINNLHTINASAGIEPVEVAREIIDMLLAAREAYGLTRGRTNAAMGSVLGIWHEHRMRALAHPESAALPSMAALRDAAAQTNMKDLVIDGGSGAVFLRERGMSLDVGSVAKGFAAGLAMAAAEEAGLRSALLSVGGHVVASGAPPGRESWTVGIRNSQEILGTVDTISLVNATVSISGAYQRFYEVDGRRFGHVIDPDTLMPADLYRQVAVVHPQSWMADALSTALFIMPREEGKALAAATGAEAFWIDMDGGKFATPGYARISAYFDMEG